MVAYDEDETSFNSSAANFESANENHSNNEKASEKIKLEVTDKKYLISDDGNDPIDTFEMSSKIAHRWRTGAVIVSWISIVLTLTIGVIEFIVAKNENSAAAFGLAFSAILDVISSAVVLWRYYGTYNTFSNRREHISCIVLGCLFIVSAIGIAGKAIFDLLMGETPDMSENGLRVLVITSAVASISCIFLFIIKTVIAKKLASWTIFTDALNSLAGAVVATSMVVTSEVTKDNSYLWFLDASVGLVVSLFLIIYGLWLLTKHVPEVKKTSGT
uniref:Transmembrane protein 163-like n=1 Tax=Phallusia mammillata TaxID=59560 RepID=A0A6F9DUC5_9ASCI|nr:transmembrane protein 163-like [Phallusia mammillata]